MTLLRSSLRISKEDCWSSLRPPPPVRSLLMALLGVTRPNDHGRTARIETLDILDGRRPSYWRSGLNPVTA